MLGGRSRGSNSNNLVTQHDGWYINEEDNKVLAPSVDEAHLGNQVVEDNVNLDNSNYYWDEGGPQAPTPLEKGGYSAFNILVNYTSYIDPTVYFAEYEDTH